MSLLKEVNDKLTKAEGPTVPDGWNVGVLPGHGVILSCDGFQLNLNVDELNKFFDLAEAGTIGEVKDQYGHIVTVEPMDDAIVLTRVGDKTYPSGIVLDLKTLKEIGVEQDAQGEQKPVQEGTRRAYRRVGRKIKRGFRITSGFRKGRVVANVRTAYKPRAKASTRMKLSIAARKHRIVRVLKSKRTRKKSLSKRLVKMNAR